MKLTKDQRYTIYCILLQEMETKPTATCLIWYIIFEEATWQEKTHLRKYLPELWEKKTRSICTRFDSWFYDTEQRIEALKQCIAETENF